MDICKIMDHSSDVFAGNGVSEEEISEAEKELGLSFSKDYVEYLSKYGSIIINGHELTGISKADQDNVVKVTKAQKKYYPFIPDNAYVVEDTCIDEIVIWQDNSGKIYKSTPDGDFDVYAKSFYDFLKKIG